MIIPYKYCYKVKIFYHLKNLKMKTKLSFCSDKSKLSAIPNRHGVAKSVGKTMPGSNGTVPCTPQSISSAFKIPSILQQQPSLITLTLRQFAGYQTLTPQQEQALIDSCRTRAFDMKNPLCPGRPRNLEILEFVGDSVIMASHARWCSRFWPMNLLHQVAGGENILTSYRAEHLGTLQLSAAARRLGLDKFLCMMPYQQGDDKVIEDCFEAWVGACSEIWTFEEIFKMLCRLLFDHISIEWQYERAICFKSRLNQICEGGLKFSYSPAGPDGKSWRSRCWMLPNAKNARVLEHGHRLVGEGEAVVDKEAAQAAAKHLFFQLEYESNQREDTARSFAAKRHPQHWRNFEQLVRQSKDKQHEYRAKLVVF